MLAVLLALAPVTTAQPPFTVTTVTKLTNWEIMRTSLGQCRAIGYFGKDKALAVWINADGAAGATVMSDKWTFTAGSYVNTVFKVGTTTYGGNAFVVANDAVRGLDTRMGSDFLPALRAATTFDVYLAQDYEGGGEPLAQLTLSGVPEMIDALRACTVPVAGRAMPAITSATKPRLLNQAEIITADDYPPTALRREAAGVTRYRIAVSAAGQITGCGIVTSSGNADLDNQTCALMRRRAKLAPGKDASGKDVVATLEGNVTWRIPQS